MIALEHATPPRLEAYLQGALKDGTFSAAHRSHRIGQKEREWLELLQTKLKELGWNSWIYREGRLRDYWILETLAPFLSTTFDATPLIGCDEGIDYVRGFFDAEGGVPRDVRARFYIQFVQKDSATLRAVREILESWGISCGRMHNPSVKVDPHYWRFYVLKASHERFVDVVGSWHPRKRVLLNERMPPRIPVLGIS